MFASYSRMCSSIASGPVPTQKVRLTYSSSRRRGLVGVASNTSSNTNQQLELLSQLLAEKDKLLEESNKRLEESSRRLIAEEQLWKQIVAEKDKRLMVEEHLRRQLLDATDKHAKEQRKRFQAELELSTMGTLHATGLLSMRGLMDWAEQQLRKKHNEAFLDAERKYNELHMAAESAKQVEIEKQQKSAAKTLQHPEEDKGEKRQHDGGWGGINPPQKSERELLWEVALSAEPGLQDCIVAKTGWQPKDIPSKLDALYTTLINKSHQIIQVSVDKVDLVVGVASEKECGALECIGSNRHVRTRIVKPFEEVSINLPDAE